MIGVLYMYKQEKGRKISIKFEEQIYWPEFYVNFVYKESSILKPIIIVAIYHLFEVRIE